MISLIYARAATTEAMRAALTFEVELLCLAHGGVETFVPVIEGLEVDPAAMCRNLRSLQVGDDIDAAAEPARRALDAPEVP